MGRQVPYTFKDGQPRKFLMPSGEVVELADEAAMVGYMLRCPHDALVAGQYDPGGIYTDTYLRINGCRKCGTWFLAYGMAFDRPAAWSMDGGPP